MKHISVSSQEACSSFIGKLLAERTKRASIGLRLYKKNSKHGSVVVNGFVRLVLLNPGCTVGSLELGTPHLGGTVGLVPEHCHKADLNLFAGEKSCLKFV